MLSLSIQPDFHPLPPPQSIWENTDRAYRPYQYPQTDPTLSFFNPMTAPFSNSESCAFYPSHVSYMNLLFALITLHLTYYDVHLNVPGFCSTLYVTHVMHCDHSDLEPQILKRQVHLLSIFLTADSGAALIYKFETEVKK